MKCVRCGKQFDDIIPQKHAEQFIISIYACPYCGKLYKFLRVVQVSEIPNDEDYEEDYWGNKVIPDSEYK